MVIITVAPGMAKRVRQFARVVARYDETDFDVRSFGAKGDGQADDTLAFRSAIAAARTVSGTVFVPAGSYAVPHALRLPAGVTLRGAGRESVLRHVDGEPEVVVVLGDKQVQVLDLSIEGRFAHGVLVHQSTDVTVARCHVSGGTVPRYGYSGGLMVVGSNRVTIEDCEFDGNGGDGYIQGSDIQCDGLGATSSDIHILRNDCQSTRVAVNIRCYDSSRTEIRGNRVSGARMLGTSNHGYGILVYPTLPNPDACFENVIVGNTVSHTDGSGIYLVRSPRSRVEDNIIDDVARIQADHTLPVAGIALNQSQYVTIARNRISNSGKAGISIASNQPSVGHVDVHDNMISATAGYGIHLRGTLEAIQVTHNSISGTHGGIGGDTQDVQTGIEIRGNELTDIQGTGIRLGNSQHSHVEGNTVRNCTGYGLDLALQDDDSTSADNDVQEAGTTWGKGSAAVRIVRGGKPLN